jgi:hypothetical protein
MGISQSKSRDSKGFTQQLYEGDFLEHVNTSHSSISDLMVNEFRQLHNIRLSTKLTHFIETIVICI